MKLKNYFLLALVTGAMFSCSGDDIVEPIAVEPDASISLAIQTDMVTKAGVPANQTTEDAQDVIKDLTVAVFNNAVATNPLVAIKTVTASATTINEVLDLEVKSGSVKILVLANAKDKVTLPTVAGGATLQNFLDLQTDLNAEVNGYLTMSSAVITTTITPNYKNCLGYAATEVAGAKTTDAITRLGLTGACDLNGSASGEITSEGHLKVYRTPSRVQLKSIVLKEGEYGKPVKLAIKSVFVANAKKNSKVASEAGWGFVESATQAWYDGAGLNLDLGSLKQHTTTADYAHLIQPLTKEVTSASAYSGLETDFFFYIYENGIIQNGNKAVTNHNGDYTLLVIKGDYTYIPKGSTVEKTDADVYYTVVVNKGVNQYDGVAAHEYVKRNVKYYIAATITGPGSDEPFELLQPACLAAKVVVVPWNVVNIDEILD